MPGWDEKSGTTLFRMTRTIFDYEPSLQYDLTTVSVQDLGDLKERPGKRFRTIRCEIKQINNRSWSLVPQFELLTVLLQLNCCHAVR